MKFEIDIFVILILCLYFLILYFMALYPLIVLFLSSFFGKALNIEQLDDNNLPEVTIIISAYNEEDLIENCIKSIFESEYDLKKIKVLVGSDGSTDGTMNILNRLKEKYYNFECYNFDRKGKNYVINQLSAKSNTDLIFYMDADCRIDKPTLKRMVEKFTDENVGAVIANMVSYGYEIENTEQSNLVENAGFRGESIYQKFELILRVHESRIFSTPGSLGAFYGIKRQYYSPLPNDKVCDDMIPILNVAKFKKRAYFDEDSYVWEVRKKTLTNELDRRVRVSAGVFSTIFEKKELLLPKYGWFSFFLWSHKLTRLLSPFYLILIFIFSFFIKDKFLMDLSFGLMLILILAAFAGYLLEKIKIKFIVFKIAVYFMTMNLGLLLAFFKFLSVRNIAIWEQK